MSSAIPPIKKTTPGFGGEGEAPVHRIRITLTSRKVKELEKGQPRRISFPFRSARYSSSCLPFTISALPFALDCRLTTSLCPLCVCSVRGSDQGRPFQASASLRSCAPPY